MRNIEVTVIGNVCKEPMINTEKKFAAVRIAANSISKDDDPETLYFEVKLFGDRLKDLQYHQPRVGDRVLIRGVLTQSSWTKDGQTKSDLVIYADSLHKIFRKEKEKGPDGPSSKKF
jgi:single-stranded DNA-binding protein